MRQEREEFMETEVSTQELIERQMQEIIALGNYEMAYLFSEEGLPMAEARASALIDRDRLLEISVMFQEVRKMADVMAGISELKEMLIEGQNRTKIVFRFFEAFEQSVVLAVVVPPKKSYRGLTNKLVRFIEKLSF